MMKSETGKLKFFLKECQEGNTLRGSFPVKETDLALFDLDTII